MASLGAGPGISYVDRSLCGVGERMRGGVDKNDVEKYCPNHRHLGFLDRFVFGRAHEPDTRRLGAR